ncbi:hypothetical protein NQ317_006170 [Molorchus minor]|uniref:Uncharacterized protein n=1 Tax=Molorchus minor TaxID=1323400 RepID=A0ABQ9JG65_9CUCU|nr:hypothetical protein NQ317_006170 [Molorchus minor]
MLRGGDKLIRLLKVTTEGNIEETNCSPLEGHTYAINHVEFSKDGSILASCSLDGCTIIWNTTTLDGHLDSVPSACFSPDGEVIISVSYNADFRIWSLEDYRCLYVKEDAHEHGIQNCDISQNLEPIPNTESDEFQFDQLEVKLWRSLQGHGGNVICVRFSKIVSEFVCSTATDRQAL